MQTVNHPRPLAAGGIGLDNGNEVLSPRRMKTRQRIMTAAIETFVTRGAAGASVEEISEQAGFTRGAFYSNFASKDALVLAIASDYCSRIVEEAPEALRQASRDRTPAHDEDSGAVIREAVNHMLGTTVDQTFLLVMRELELYALRSPELARAICELQAECRRYFGEILGQGMEIGRRELLLPRDHAIDIVVALLDTEGFHEVLHAASRNERSFGRFSSTLSERVTEALLLISRFRPS